MDAITMQFNALCSYFQKSVKSLGNNIKSTNQRNLWHKVLSNITMLMDQQQVIEDMLKKAQQNTPFGSGESAAVRNPDIEKLIAAKVVMEETVQHLCPWVSMIVPSKSLEL